MQYTYNRRASYWHSPTTLSYWYANEQKFVLGNSYFVIFFFFFKHQKFYCPWLARAESAYKTKYTALCIRILLYYKQAQTLNYIGRLNFEGPKWHSTQIILEIFCYWAIVWCSCNCNFVAFCKYLLQICNFNFGVELHTACGFTCQSHTNLHEGYATYRCIRFEYKRTMLRLPGLCISLFRFIDYSIKV